jgi:hypothetical protein
MDKARISHANDFGVKLVGVASVLERISIVPDKLLVHVKLELPEAEASQFVEKVVALRGLRHPMPNNAAPPAGTGKADEVVKPAPSAPPPAESATPAPSAPAE